MAVAVFGLTALRAQLASLDRKLLTEVPKMSREAAMPVAREAVRLAPVGETGRLARSIRPIGQAKAALVAAGSSAVPYAGPIHFGWAGHNIAPNPFLYEALDRRSQEVIESYQRQLDELIADAFPL